MAAAVPIARGMEAGVVHSSRSEGAVAAAKARVSSNHPLHGRQFVGLHSTRRSKPSSSAADCCSSSSCVSSSCCISRQSNYRPSSNRLQLAHNKPAAPLGIKARKRNGRLVSRRAPETASKGSKTREESGGSVALKDAESATVPTASSCVNRSLSRGLVALRVPETAPDLAFSSSSSSSSSANSDLIGGLIALKIPDIVTVPAISFSDPNPAFPAAGELRLAPADDSEEAIEEVCTGGSLSATLPSLIRVQIQEAELFGPSIFNVSKLRVLLLGKHEDERPLQHPRIYTLTHSDLTAMITLAVAREINKAQVMGWYSKLQRDEVLAEWRRTQDEMSLHVHCHISGTNFLHRFFAGFRFYIFQKELPLVLEVFRQGDRDLFEKHPELLNAPVWVYFHSNVEDYNRVECWGPLVNARKKVQIQQWGPNEKISTISGVTGQHFPGATACLGPCQCCSRHETVIPIAESLSRRLRESHLQQRRRIRTGASQPSSSYFSGPTRRIHVGYTGKSSALRAVPSTI